AVARASTVTSVVRLVLLAMFQAEACRPTKALGAYFRTIAIMHWPMPPMVLGSDPQSVGLALATAAARAVGEPACRAKPQKSGSMCRKARDWPICWSRNRQSVE